MNRLGHTLVTAKWLHGCLGASNVRILDATWHLPKLNRDAKAEYQEKHIPEALYFDIDECCDKRSPYGHMLPVPADFEDYVGKLGIKNTTHVVVYDNGNNFGFFSSQRVWWMFRVFGHEMVSILNGGFANWVSEGYDVTSDIPSVPKENYKATFNKQMVKYFEDMKKNVEDRKFQVADARGPGRFNGTEPEPRPGIEPGHIAGSVNLPYTKVTNPETRLMRSPEELENIFKEANIDLNKPLVATCGSGVTACCIALAAHLCGKDIPAVYDGAWTEWYLRSSTEKQ